MTTTLRNAARAKPLVLLEGAESGLLVRQRQLALPEDLAPLVAANPQPEACLLAVLGAERYEEAAVLLSGFLRRRMSALWGWWCVYQTLAAAAQARTVQTPPAVAPAIAAAAAAGAGGAPAAGPSPVQGIDPGIGMGRADFAPPPPTPAQAQMMDPAAWPKPSVGPQGLVWLPPLLQDDPQRRRTLAERYFARRNARLAAMAPEERAATEARLAAGRERMLAAFGGSPREKLVELTRQRLQAHADAKARAQAPFDRLTGALDGKKAEILACTDAVKARLAAMRTRLPTRAPRPDDPGSGHAASAMEAARLWLLDPDQTNARTAFAAGKACKGAEKPAGLVAMACFWSGTDLQPADAPKEAQPISPPAGLAPRAVCTALQLARHLIPGGPTPEEWLQRYLGWGIEIAQGLLTVDQLLHLRTQRTSSWAGRSGFGRLVARPEQAEGEAAAGAPAKPEPRKPTATAPVPPKPEPPKPEPKPEPPTTPKPPPWSIRTPRPY
ncbi:MAG: hypothetical protein L6R48_23215 [Planctomycetes bacterium]|nr:hypothetical protein [Planctomycetota bacterium]